jgi:arabinofuranan 3-O-arabinosyltransferase
MVLVDGVSHRTEVVGTVGAMVDGARLAWRVCDAATPTVSLGAGAHRIDVVGTDTWSPTSAVLRSLTPSQSTAEGGSRVVLGSSDDVVRVGPGSAAILLLGQNQNIGWRAALNGRELAPIVVDGWQQGFIVPAGPGGTVRMTFAGNAPYRGALLVGALAALLLLLLLLLDIVRPQPITPEPADSEPAVGHWLRRRIGLVAAIGVSAVLGGPVFAGGVAVGALLRLRIRAAVIGGLAGALVTLSGILALVDGRVATGSTFLGADIAAAIGIGLAAAVLTSDASGGAES